MKLRKAPLIAAGLGVVALISLIGNVVLYNAYARLGEDTMTDTEDVIVATGKDDLTQKAYTSPGRWLWRPEARGVARQQDDMVPEETPEIGVYLDPFRGRHKDTQTTTRALLEAYMRDRDMLAKLEFKDLAHDGLFCDENVAIFRNMLMRMGIQSRVVVFEFGDGKGKFSHTALEVWVPQRAAWAYTDPHYGVFDLRDVRTIAREVAESGTLPNVLVPANTQQVTELFTDGIKELIYERYAPRSRIVYKPAGDLKAAF